LSTTGLEFAVSEGESLLFSLGLLTAAGQTFSVAEGSVQVFTPGVVTLQGNPATISNAERVDFQSGSLQLINPVFAPVQTERVSFTQAALQVTGASFATSEVIAFPPAAVTVQSPPFQVEEIDLQLQFAAAGVILDPLGFSIRHGALLTGAQLLRAKSLSPVRSAAGAGPERTARSVAGLRTLKSFKE
jgi:hypothetical protein